MVRVTIPRSPGHQGEVIRVAVTVSSGNGRHNPAHIARRGDGRIREFLVDYGDDAGLVQAIRDAFRERL